MPHLPASDGVGSTVVVVGDPIGHSLSPALHNAAFAAANEPHSMVAVRVQRDQGHFVADWLREGRVAGVAVTMPLKTEMLAHCTAVSDIARQLGAVNTLTWRGDGIHGHNTDAQGFLDGVAAAGESVAGRSVLVIGAGGAARAVIAGVANGGASEIAVMARRLEAAETAAAAAGPEGVAGAGTFDRAGLDSADFEIVINATPVGMAGVKGPPEPPGIGRLHAGQLVIDLIYRPAQTALLVRARAAGARTLGGFPMLLHQAAGQQFEWFGRLADVGAMEAAVRLVEETSERG